MGYIRISTTFPFMSGALLALPCDTVLVVDFLNSLEAGDISEGSPASTCSTKCLRRRYEGESKVIRPFILRRKKDEVEKHLPGKSQVILERIKQKMNIDAKHLPDACIGLSALLSCVLFVFCNLGPERDVREEIMLEKMDEERRKKENYVVCLMEDHEVPEWAYATPYSKEAKSKGFDISEITGEEKETRSFMLMH
ncbi:hypothetical protein CRG98_017197 [Punica granatum]|uniref:Uncharacterized protein n=1 Tax=Punica granatum TaxID=22663 RepID=A0A2I0K1F6_PUNGR|nr:hypothetical protein CRG98_017197 [Punica granatum]